MKERAGQFPDWSAGQNDDCVWPRDCFRSNATSQNRCPRQACARNRVGLYVPQPFPPVSASAAPPPPTGAMENSDPSVSDRQQRRPSCRGSVQPGLFSARPPAPGLNSCLCGLKTERNRQTGEQKDRNMSELKAGRHRRLGVGGGVAQ